MNSTRDQFLSRSGLASDENCHVAIAANHFDQMAHFRDFLIPANQLSRLNPGIILLQCRDSLLQTRTVQGIRKDCSKLGKIKRLLQKVCGARSEERRVGKECRSRWGREGVRKKT